MFIYIVTGTLFLVLVRWFTAHPDAVERDNLCRPICPGALHYNHCLWRYATSANPRRVMCAPDGSPAEPFLQSRFTFGRNHTQSDIKGGEEKHAYYGLISPSSIISTVSMSNEYDCNSMKHTGDWLETVTVV